MSETLRLLEQLWQDMQPFFLQSTPELYAQVIAGDLFRVLCQRNSQYRQLRTLRTQTKEWSPEQVRLLVESVIREEREKLRELTAAKHRQADVASVDVRTLDTLLSVRAKSFK